MSKSTMAKKKSFKDEKLAISEQMKKLQEKMKKIEEKEVFAKANLLKKYDLLDIDIDILEKYVSEIAEKIKKDHPNAKK